LCGVTGVAYFYQFGSKNALGVAAADYWSGTTSALFKAAPYHLLDDPLERIFAYVGFRREIIVGEFAEFTCLVGTMVQEAYSSSPAIRDACANSIFGRAATLEPDIRAPILKYGIVGDWTAESLARHTQTAIQ
jgi:TetR/AcrR family transcriptional regulator, transcriptional repressor for nem operon